MYRKFLGRNITYQTKLYERLEADDMIGSFTIRLTRSKTNKDKFMLCYLLCYLQSVIHFGHRYEDMNIHLQPLQYIN